MNRLLLGYSPEYDLFEKPAARARSTAGASRAAVLFDTETTGSAAELLNAPGGAALASALGRQVRNAAGRAGAQVDAAVGAEIVRLLHGAARQALPALGVAPGTPRRVAARQMGRFFGIELEGLSPEDQEFESARRFAQLTQQAAREAASASPRLSPAAAAQWAVARAARQYAPGLARLVAAPAPPQAGRGAAGPPFHP